MASPSAGNSDVDVGKFLRFLDRIMNPRVKILFVLSNNQTNQYHPSGYILKLIYLDLATHKKISEVK